ncbi:hypothetical protein ACI5FR_22870 [Paenibacillus sp. HJGM_3]
MRPGYTVLGAAIGTKVLGLGVWKDTELHAVFNDGTWRKWTGSAWTTLASGLSTTAEAYFTNFQGAFTDINLIMANGVDAVKKYDGTTVSNLLNAPANAKYITTFQNRLWVSLGKEIRASSLDNGEEWSVFTDDSKSFGKDIESPQGEMINGLFGELNKLTISFPNSIRKLMGSVPSDFNDQNVSQTLGITNNRSAVTLDGTMYLFNPSGLYSYGGGISPDKSFSQAVQYYPDNSNAIARGQSAAGSDGKNLYFSIPVESSSAPDTIIEYDNQNRTWNVWNDLSALHFTKMGNDLYIGDASGRVLKMGGTSDNGTAINWHWVSKVFTAPSMAQVIRWLSMWITVSLPVGSTMNVYLSKQPTGDDTWESVGSITASSSLQKRSIYVQSSKVVNATQMRFMIAGTGPVTIHEVSFEQDQLPLR